MPIQLEVDGSPDPDVLELLAPHYPRLDVVDFVNTPISTFHLIMDNHLAHMLRSSSLLQSIRLLALGDVSDTQVVPIRGEFPLLERLELDDIRASINNIRAPNLRVLRLTCTYNLTSLLDFLEACPRLEDLQLRFQHLDGETPRFRRRIDWENLRTLLLFRDGSRVLRHISLPPGAKVNLITRTIPEDMVVGQGNDDDLLQAWSHLPMFRQSRSLFLMIAGSFQTISLDGPNGYLRLKTPPAHLILKSFAQHSIDTIRNLEVQGVSGNNFDFNLIPGFLRPLNGLSSLKLRRTTLSPWILALDQEYCPQLRDLTLRQSPPSDCEGLVKFVMGRSKAGVPIHQLSVTKDVQDLFHTSDGKRRLEEHVQCVEWGIL